MEEGVVETEAVACASLLRYDLRVLVLPRASMETDSETSAAVPMTVDSDPPRPERRWREVETRSGAAEPVSGKAYWRASRHQAPAIVT